MAAGWLEKTEKMKRNVKVWITEGIAETDDV